MNNKNITISSDSIIAMYKERLHSEIEANITLNALISDLNKKIEELQSQQAPEPQDTSTKDDAQG